MTSGLPLKKGCKGTGLSVLGMSTLWLVVVESLCGVVVTLTVVESLCGIAVVLPRLCIITTISNRKYQTFL